MNPNTASILRILDNRAKLAQRTINKERRKRVAPNVFTIVSARLVMSGDSFSRGEKLYSRSRHMSQADYRLLLVERAKEAVRANSTRLAERLCCKCTQEFGRVGTYPKMVEMLLASPRFSDEELEALEEILCRI